jgi:hypothetical protein
MCNVNTACIVDIGCFSGCASRICSSSSTTLERSIQLLDSSSAVFNRSMKFVCQIQAFVCCTWPSCVRSSPDSLKLCRRVITSAVTPTAMRMASSFSRLCFFSSNASRMVNDSFGGPFLNIQHISPMHPMETNTADRISARSHPEKEPQLIHRKIENTCDAIIVWSLLLLGGATLMRLCWDWLREMGSSKQPRKL